MNPKDMRDVETAHKAVVDTFIDDQLRTLLATLTSHPEWQSNPLSAMAQFAEVNADRVASGRSSVWDLAASLSCALARLAQVQTPRRSWWQRLTGKRVAS